MYNFNFQAEIKEFVKYRGYGPWYQEQAWQHVIDWPVDLFRLMVYLDERYPKLTEGDGN